MKGLCYYMIRNSLQVVSIVPSFSTQALVLYYQYPCLVITDYLLHPRL